MGPRNNVLDGDRDIPREDKVLRNDDQHFNW